MIKALRSGLNSIAFSTESLNLYPLSAGLADSLPTGEPASEDSHKLTEGDRINHDRAGISRLVLLITQTCYLKCSFSFKENITQVAEFISDEEKWNRFVENVNRSCVRYGLSEQTPSHPIREKGGLSWLTKPM